MMCKSLLVFLVVYFLSDYSNGQKEKQFFRNDYNYIEATESFYKIHTSPKTWANAKHMCALEGASLFYAENSDEARAVGSFWKKTQPTIPLVYVGISALINKGVFETIDSRPISEVYDNWQPGEPNSWLNIEDCVYLTKEGTLYDVRCDLTYQFICKKTLSSLDWDYRCNMSNQDYTFFIETSKCYKLHTTPLNWTDAYGVCGAEQSYLAVISNWWEAEYLAKLTESASKEIVKGDYLRGIFHVGFHNRFKEGWKTVRGTPLNCPDAWWGNYQPEVDQEQCGAMFYTGRLTHVNCDIQSFFICEHEGNNFTFEQLQKMQIHK